MIRIRARAFALLLRIFVAGLARGLEVHAYALGRRMSDGAVIEEFVTTPTTRASSVIVEPDYGAAGLLCAPYFARGLVLLGEVHSHVAGPVGPSGGDVRTLRAISTTFPGYLCLVVTNAERPVLTAHAIRDGELVEHQVVMDEYALLSREDVAHKRAFVIGVGSGTAALTLPLFKLGFGQLTVADADRVEARNVERHFATSTGVGSTKVSAFKRFARGRTNARVRTLPLALTDATAERFRREFRSSDVIINGTGHPVVSRRASYLARQEQRTIIHGGVFPRGSGGFVFLDTPGGACYSCLFDLHLEAAADDAETMHTLTDQYGLTEEQLSAQLGLFADVHLVASLHLKILLEYLKGNTPHNLYLVDNEQLTITAHHVAQRPACICKGDVA